MPLSCEHSRTEIIARRDGVDYLRCIDCDEVFEAEDVDPAAMEDDEDQEN
jgi:hypothetical protein